MCIRNLREKFPAAAIVVAKILPAHGPGERFYEDIKRTNAALDGLLAAGGDAKLVTLDMWGEFTRADGTLRKELFTADSIHLSPAGYAAYAKRLEPLLDAAIER
jgi:lysophospholipase L1-like esterase